MSGTKFPQLSDRQKQCLRLVYANLEAKEIAAELKLSPYTVKEHLRDARRILGASRSINAARQLVEYERDTYGVPPPKRVDTVKGVDDDESAVKSDNHRSAVRNRYSLDLLQRIGLIVAIALSAVALAGALIVGAEAITRIFRAEGVNLSDSLN